MQEWHVTGDNRMGDFYVLPVDRLAGEGWPALASSPDEGLVQHIAALHNAWLKGETA